MEASGPLCSFSAAVETSQTLPRKRSDRVDQRHGFPFVLNKGGSYQEAASPACPGPELGPNPAAVLCALGPGVSPLPHQASKALSGRLSRSSRACTEFLPPPHPQKAWGRRRSRAEGPAQVMRLGLQEPQTGFPPRHPRIRLGHAQPGGQQTRGRRLARGFRVSPAPVVPPTQRSRRLSPSTWPAQVSRWQAGREGGATDRPAPALVASAGPESGEGRADGATSATRQPPTAGESGGGELGGRRPLQVRVPPSRVPELFLASPPCVFLLDLQCLHPPHRSDGASLPGPGPLRDFFSRILLRQPCVWGGGVGGSSLQVSPARSSLPGGGGGEWGRLPPVWAGGSGGQFRERIPRAGAQPLICPLQACH